MFFADIGDVINIEEPPNIIRLRAIETTQTIKDDIKDKENEIALLTSKITSSTRLADYTKTNYENSGNDLKLSEQKKIAYQTTIHTLTQQMDETTHNIEELNRLTNDLDIKSTAIETEAEKILEVISSKLKKETKLFSDIEEFIEFKKTETDKYLESYIESQARVLEQTKELSKKHLELDNHKQLLKTQLDIIKQQTRIELQTMFQSRIHKLTEHFKKDMTYEEGTEICNSIDKFISMLIPVTLY